MRTRAPRPGPARDRAGGAGTGRWLAAEVATVVGATCVALHVVTALAGRHDEAWVRVLLLAMAAACLPCLRQLRRAPTRRTWAVTAGMYAAMLAAHLSVVTPWSAPAAGTHSMAGPLTWTDVGMWGGLALAAVQVVLAVLALAAAASPAPRVRRPAPARPRTSPARPAPARAGRR